MRNTPRVCTLVLSLWLVFYTSINIFPSFCSFFFLHFFPSESSSFLFLSILPLLPFLLIPILTFYVFILFFVAFLFHYLNFLPFHPLSLLFLLPISLTPPFLAPLLYPILLPSLLPSHLPSNLPSQVWSPLLSLQSYPIPWFTCHSN